MFVSAQLEICHIRQFCAPKLDSERCNRAPRIFFQFVGTVITDDVILSSFERCQEFTAHRDELMLATDFKLCSVQDGDGPSIAEVEAAMSKYSTGTRSV